LIAALLAAATTPGVDGVPGMTTMEMVIATNRSQKWVRERLHRLKADGRLSIDFGCRESLSGAMVAVPVYRLNGHAEDDEANENPAG
jgi:hypothetical protein